MGTVDPGRKPSFVLADSPESPVEARDSATVILARDAPSPTSGSGRTGGSGIEVFMLERVLKADFVGGAFVFPGGILDPQDIDPDVYGLTDGPDVDQAAKLMDAEASKGLGFYLCAIRETFEESGALLARDARGALVPDAHQEQRTEIHSGRLSLAAFAQRNGLRFAADLLKPWARWITPSAAPKRYDTRFFVAEFPDVAQALLHDEIESTSSRWISPAEALRQHKEGTFTVIFPTRVTLTQLSRFASVEALMRQERDLSPVSPEIIQQGSTIKILIPGDPEPYEP